MKIQIDEEKCIGCGTCVIMCDECFEMEGSIAKVKKEDCECQSCSVNEVAESCPVGVIKVTE